MKKTVLITGASSGFGKAAVTLFHKKGWNVVATLRSPQKDTELSRLADVLVTRLDVTDVSSIAAAVQAGVDRFGRIDVLVNNAGYGTLGALEAASDAVIKRQFDVNVFGLISMAKAVLPGMRAQRSGVLINVSSVGGRVTFPFCTLYHATKFAVEGLTESLQYEVNPFGIRCKIVEPGGYKTNFAGSSMDFYGAGGIDGYQQPYDRFMGNLEHWPMSEDLSEVAEAIFAAATDDTDQLRYPVGHDAGPLLEMRKQVTDADFKNLMIERTLG